MNIIFFLALLKQIRYGKIANLRWENHFIISPIFGLAYSLMIALWTKSGNLLDKLKSFLLMFGTDFILLQIKMLKTQSIFILPVIYFLVIGSAIVYRKCVYQQKDEGELIV